MTITADRDLELWRTWKRTGAIADLEALMRQFMPLIHTEVAQYKNVVPENVLLAEAKVLAKHAFDTYAPTASTQLNTHVVWQLKKLRRLFYERQSTVRVPEHLRIQHNQYRRALTDLEDRLGFRPTLEHVADHLGVPLPKLTHLIATVEKKELLESGEGPTFGHADDDAVERDAIERAYHTMTPQQQKIFDYRTGSHGVRELSDNGAIVAAMGIPQWKLSEELVAIRKLLERAKTRSAHV